MRSILRWGRSTPMRKGNLRFKLPYPEVFLEQRYIPKPLRSVQWGFSFLSQGV